MPLNQVGSVTVLASSPQLQSGQANTVTITAQVKDDNNAVLEGVTVQFSASSGSLAVTQAVSDGSGIAIAQLSAGTNLANRAITVTAQAGEVSGNVIVNVVGTTLSITGPAALAQGDTGAYVAVAKDSTGAGINGSTLALTSANGNTISAASLTASHACSRASAIFPMPTSEALKSATSCLEHDAENMKCLAIAANSSKELGDVEAHHAYMARYQALNPDDPATLFNQAAEFLNALDDEHARPLLERCLAVDPAFPECLFEYAMVLLRSGDLEGAKAHLQRYLEVAPDGPDAAAARETVKYL